MTKPIFCILFALTFSYYGWGQANLRPTVRRGFPINRRVNQQNPGKKIEQVKETFIGKQLKLTQAESQAFLPIYREYVQRSTAIRILKRMNNSNTAVDGAEQIRKDMEYDSQLLALKKQYNQEYLRILPPEKVSELYKSERQFNDEALRILSEKSIRAGD